MPRLWERVAGWFKATPQYWLSIESAAFKYEGKFFTAFALQAEMTRILKMLRDAGCTPSRMVISRQGETVVIGS